MVPALDIIQPRVAMTREAKELRHRHHRHHRHSHHGNPPSESGHSAFSAPIPTKPVQDMGPDNGLYGQQRQQISTGSIKHYNIYDSNANQQFYGSLQRHNTSSVEAMNRPNDWYVLYVYVLNVSTVRMYLRMYTRICMYFTLTYVLNQRIHFTHVFAYVHISVYTFCTCTLRMYLTYTVYNVYCTHLSTYAHTYWYVLYVYVLYALQE